MEGSPNNNPTREEKERTLAEKRGLLKAKLEKLANLEEDAVNDSSNSTPVSSGSSNSILNIGRDVARTPVASRKKKVESSVLAPVAEPEAKIEPAPKEETPLPSTVEPKVEIPAMAEEAPAVPEKTEKEIAIERLRKVIEGAEKKLEANAKLRKELLNELATLEDKEDYRDKIVKLGGEREGEIHALPQVKFLIDHLQRILKDKKATAELRKEALEDLALSPLNLLKRHLNLMDKLKEWDIMKKIQVDIDKIEEINKKYNTLIKDLEKK